MPRDEPLPLPTGYVAPTHDGGAPGDGGAEIRKCKTGGAATAAATGGLEQGDTVTVAAFAGAHAIKVFHSATDVPTKMFPFKLLTCWQSPGTTVTVF